MTLPTRCPSLNPIALVLLAASLAAPLYGCVNGTGRAVVNGGELQARKAVPAPRKGPYVLIFALEGAGYDQFTSAIRSGQCSNMQSLMGREMKAGVFEHAYSAPNAVSVLPSATIPAWASAFTGAPPAYNGITGNEWYDRRKMAFYAPAPVSVKQNDDAIKSETEDLVDRQLQAPTLFQMVSGPSFASLNPIHRGAAVFTIVSPGAFAGMLTDFAAAKLDQSANIQQSAYARLDLNSVPKIISNIERNGIATVQVAYFPGIDLYAKLANDPLRGQVSYLENVIDPSVGKILEEYRTRNVLDQTFVMFVSDHGFTPVIKDERHNAGANPDKGVPGMLGKVGFRVRPMNLTTAADQDDYEAVVAYQGAMAYLYLADRSACAKGYKCHWDRPPRFDQDVMPVVRALYKASTGPGPFSQLYGSIDLIFARKPSPAGEAALPYEIYDGHNLVPIRQYLKHHPRPDLVQLDRRMQWLSAGPYGYLAGDVLVMAKSGLNRDIRDRFYFTRPYRSWHGSASEQDSRVTMVLANQQTSGADLQQLFDTITHSEPSLLEVVPLVRAMLNQGKTTEPAATPSGSAR